MDEWTLVQQKIKDLENSFLESSPDVRSTVDTVSIADFWKRRYEEEKQLWEEKLANKEKEHSRVHAQFLMDEEGIRELNFKVKEMERRLETEKILFEERSKIKTLEADLEKKKIEWESKLKMLENENEELRTRIRRGTASSEEEIRRRQQMETEKSRMEAELKTLQNQIQTITLEEQKRIGQLESEKQAVLKQMEDLKFVRKDDAGKSGEIAKEMSLLKAERNKHLAQLEEREKEQLLTFEDLTRGFAHKVRNYLGIMSGTLQLCLVNFKMEEELKKQMTIIDQNAQEMLKSIEEFLALTKIPEMTLQTVNVNELLSNVIFSTDDMARKQNVRIEKKFAESLPPASIESRLLSEGIKQLLSNSIEASAAGGEISVASSFDTHSNRIVIRVVDSGKGISENHFKKVLQPYFSTKKGKKGLGLCIAKRAVDLHHGAMTISSAKDQGTTVTLYLPAQKT